MAADNVKTAFRLPSGVNEDFISQHHQQQQHQKKYQPATTKYESVHIRRYLEIYIGKDLC